MPKVLIVAFAYAPAPLIAAQRVQSWALGLVRMGFDVSVVTRHWNGDEGMGSASEASNLAPSSVAYEDGVRTFRLAYDNTRYLAHLKKQRISRLYGGFLNLLTYNTSVNPYNYLDLQRWLVDHLKSESYDFVIVSTPPIQYIKLAHWIKVRYEIPIWIDFRDYLFIHKTCGNLIQETPFLRRLALRNVIRLTRNYLSSASVISCVSRPIIDDLALRVGVPVHCIPNGYDLDCIYFSGNKPFPNGVFLVSILGNLYPIQDLNFFFEVFRLFLKDKVGMAKLRFIGTGVDNDTRELIEKSLPKNCIEITDWLPRKYALELASLSHVLCQIGVRGLKGSYSGKIFEYLGLRRPIFVAPSDNDVMADLVGYTNAGVAVQTIDEALLALDNWYSQWRVNGCVPYHGINERLIEYSRERQASYVGKIMLRQLELS